MSQTARTVLVTITGRVQGVWFRDWTKRQADRLALSGWVRNRPDASVEVLLCGDRESVDDMIRKCHTGSPMSRVDNIVVNDHEGGGPEQGFEIRETG
jgi:acylphosphatase